MDEQRLKAIEVRCAAATEAPWWVDDFVSPADGSWTVYGWYVMEDGHKVCPRIAAVRLPMGGSMDGQNQANAAFIAHARSDVPDLAQALRDRDEEIARLRDQLALLEIKRVRLRRDP